MKDNKIEVVAFYLPQYHPTPENDAWYGKGFTEWTNVGKSKPLFWGHYQPKVPADIGYYDLRLTEVRRLQAELAREAGITAFCYYHYWFGKGKMLLHEPIEWMLESGQPDMPFCLCWANHKWYNKTWNSAKSVLDKKELIGIDYGDEADWKLHFESLLPAFKSERYYKIDGRNVFVLYRLQDIPNVEDFKRVWNEQAKKHGLPEFYFVNYIDDVAKLNDPIYNSCEKKIVMLKANIDSIGSNAFVRKLSRFIKVLAAQILHIPTGVCQYAKIRKKLSGPVFAQEDVIPTLLPNWDNTPRRAEGAMVLHNATPEQFYEHCKETFAYVRGKQNKVVFLKSWNEWGEGNYMEPCIQYGHGYLQALKRALDDENTNRRNIEL